jgi:LacI family transcriptional regulator
LRASTLAARYLIGLGHTRISFIGGEASNPTRSDRIRGYADALADAGLEFRPSLVGAPVKELDRASGIEWLLAHPERPTAVLCFNDVVAISLNKQLHECGLLAGRDLSIVGFDDTRDARMAYPLLSTVALHPSKIGEMAFQLLSKRISDRSAPLQKIMIVPDFVERDSSRPLLGSSAGDIHRTQSAAGTLPGAEARIAAASSDVETGNFSGGEPGTIC